MKINCWQVKNCGRQPGGSKIVALGICPAAIDESSNGKNNGINAGRYCWKISGTLCGGQVQGTYAQKLLNCVACEFYKQVKQEEGTKFHP